MKEIEQINTLPEVKASVYAKAFGFSKRKANDMCAANEIPCRKIGSKNKKSNIDTRPWMVNMIAIRKQLESEAKVIDKK
jgi:hypothetical protein